MPPHWGPSAGASVLPAGAQFPHCLEGKAQLCSIQLLPPFLHRGSQGCLLLFPCQEHVIPTHSALSCPPGLLAWPCTYLTESPSLEEIFKITKSNHHHSPTIVTPKPHPYMPHPGGS